MEIFQELVLTITFSLLVSLLIAKIFSLSSDCDVRGKFSSKGGVFDDVVGKNCVFEEVGKVKNGGFGDVGKIERGEVVCDDMVGVESVEKSGDFGAGVGAHQVFDESSERVGSEEFEMGLLGKEGSVEESSCEDGEGKIGEMGRGCREELGADKVVEERSERMEFDRVEMRLDGSAGRVVGMVGEDGILTVDCEDRIGNGDGVGSRGGEETLSEIAMAERRPHCDEFERDMVSNEVTMVGLVGNDEISAVMCEGNTKSGDEEGGENKLSEVRVTEVGHERRTDFDELESGVVSNQVKTIGLIGSDGVSAVECEGSTRSGVEEGGGVCEDKLSKVQVIEEGPEPRMDADEYETALVRSESTTVGLVANDEDLIVKNEGDHGNEDKEGCGSGEDKGSGDEWEWEGIERNELEKSFGAAVAFVGSKSNADRISLQSNEVKMQLYGLHKVATEGPCSEPQPMVLKVSARANWNAWKQHGNISPEEAMEHYISLLTEKIPDWIRGDVQTDSEKENKMEQLNPCIKECYALSNADPALNLKQ